MAENGKLSPSELASIPGGRLSKPAAAAWNANGGPADNGLRPTGPNSSYRLYGPITQYGTQQYFYAHQPPLAAYPGTSNHGWGLAVDLLEEWMRSWIDDHGARFGWRKLEAFSEWWHVNYDGSKKFATFVPLEKGDRSKRVKFYVKRLRFIHPDGVDHGYFVGRPRRKFDRFVRGAVIRFQRDHALSPDGVIGEKTAHKISEVFHRQYVNRNKRKRLVRTGERTVKVLGRQVPALKVQQGGRKRRKRDVVRLRP